MNIETIGKRLIYLGTLHDSQNELEYAMVCREGAECIKYLVDIHTIANQEKKVLVKRLKSTWGNGLPVNFTKIIHTLKIKDCYNESEIGTKTFEICKNDRNYRVGDVLILWEETEEGEQSRYHRRMEPSKKEVKKPHEYKTAHL